MSKWQKRIEDFLSRIEPQSWQKPALAADLKRAEAVYMMIRQKIAAATNNSVLLNESYEDFKKDFIDGLRHPFFLPWR